MPRAKPTSTWDSSHCRKLEMVTRRWQGRPNDAVSFLSTASSNLGRISFIDRASIVSIRQAAKLYGLGVLPGDRLSPPWIPEGQLVASIRTHLHASCRKT